MIKDRRWVNPNDPGILRKKNDENSDLFVFGYSCKIFRDDQRALEMDQGKQLIPWMGDESLKIDRYDARGHLSELSPYEGASQVYVPTAEEKKIEALCDEERYRALSVNEEESLLYQEEELKRLKQLLNTDKTYGQVAYQYTEPVQMSKETENNLEVQETDDDEFVPNSLLDIPPQMFLPRTVKENQIIEKTAAHVAVHGPQVEIVIKTRQANNAKLNFLHVDSPLYPYYQLVLSNIKSGRFHTPRSLPTTTDSDQDHYLHPSLVSTVESAPSIPSIPYKPSSDCAYNALVKNIRTVQEAAEQPREEPTRTTQDSSSSESYHTFEEMSTQENPAIWGNRSPNLLTPPDHLFTTSSGSSPGTPSAVEQPKKKRKPPRTIFPANKAKRLISGMVKYAYRTNQDPSSLLNELGGSGPNINFTQPGHLFYEYYKKQYKVTFKTTTSPKAYPSANGTATVSAPPVAATATCTGATDKEPSTSEPQDKDSSFNQSSDLHSVGVIITEGKLSPVLAQKTQTPQEIKNEEKLTQTVSPKSKTLISQTAQLKVGYEKASPALTDKTKCSTPQSTVCQPSQPSSSGDGNSRIGKPAPVSFSIKKPKEERLEHASIFPLEESSSEEDEEVREIKSTQQKVETDKAQTVDRQQSPVKDQTHSNDELDLSALIDGLRKVHEESLRNKKKGGEKTSESSGHKRTRESSSKETKTKEVGTNGKYPSSHSVAGSTTSAKAEEKSSKLPSKGDRRKSPKASTKGEEKRRGSTSKLDDKKPGRSTREHSRKRKHERKEAPNSNMKMPKKTMEAEEDDFFSDLLYGLDYPDVSSTSQESMDKKANENKKKEERKRKVKEMLAKLSQASAESSSIYLSSQSSKERNTEDTEIISSPESSQIPEKGKEENAKAEETEEMMRQRVREALIRYNKAASEKFPLYKDRPNSPLTVHIRSAPLHLMSSAIKKIEEEKEKHKRSPTSQKFNPTGIWDPENPVPSTSNSTDIRYVKDIQNKTKERRPCRPPPGFDPLPVNEPDDDLKILDFLMSTSPTSSNTSNSRYRSIMEKLTAAEIERTRTESKSKKNVTHTSTKKKSSCPKSPDMETNRFSQDKNRDKSPKVEDVYTKKKSHKKHHHTHSHKSKKYRKKVEKHMKHSKRSRSASSSSD